MCRRDFWETAVGRSSVGGDWAVGKLNALNATNETRRRKTGQRLKRGRNVLYFPDGKETTSVVERSTTVSVSDNRRREPNVYANTNRRAFRLTAKFRFSRRFTTDFGKFVFPPPEMFFIRPVRFARRIVFNSRRRAVELFRGTFDSLVYHPPRRIRHTRTRRRQSANSKV